MALRTNSPLLTIYNTAAPSTSSINSRLSQGSGFRNQSAEIYQRASLNPNVFGVANLINTTPANLPRFNGSSETFPLSQAPNFNGSIVDRIADNSIEGGNNRFNLERSGFNTDIRAARAGFENAFPANLPRPKYANGRPFNYPNSWDVRGPIRGYPYGYSSPYYGQQYYPNGTKIPYSPSYYPPSSPECKMGLSCTSYDNPNDCRSCVIANGGAPHCARQICGDGYL